MAKKYSQEKQKKKKKKSQKTRDFPGGPVVKTLPSNTGGVISTPGGGAKIPTCLEVAGVRVGEGI